MARVPGVGSDMARACVLLKNTACNPLPVKVRRKYPAAFHHAGGLALRDPIAGSLVAQAQCPEMEGRGTLRDALTVGKIAPEVVAPGFAQYGLSSQPASASSSGNISPQKRGNIPVYSASR